MEQGKGSGVSSGSAWMACGSGIHSGFGGGGTDTVVLGGFALLATKFEMWI
jgi:hypothetical protein